MGNPDILIFLALSLFALLVTFFVNHYFDLRAARRALRTASPAKPRDPARLLPWLGRFFFTPEPTDPEFLEKLRPVLRQEIAAALKGRRRAPAKKAAPRKPAAK